MESQLEIDWERVPSIQWRAQARAKEKSHARDTLSRFEAWLENNADFYARFLNLARKQKHRGKKASADVLAHVVKYLSDRKIPEGTAGWIDGFTPYLARKAMKDNPDLEGLFELRGIAATGKTV